MDPSFLSIITEPLSKPTSAGITETKIPAQTSEEESQSDPGNQASPNHSFNFTIPLSIDTDQDTYLSNSPAQTNTSEEELFPREVIATAIGSTNLKAELGRPIKLGTFNDLPAYLLRTTFTFQRVNTGSFHRVQAAEVTIVFEDALEAQNGSSGSDKKVREKGKVKGKVKTASSRGKHPAVAAWYPSLFEGDVSTEAVKTTVEGSLGATYLGAGASIKVGQTKTSTSTSRITVHGVRGGGRHLNAITWTIEEDRIAKNGIPRKISLPLIITHQNQSNRFSACVTVKAQFGFWRGALARSVPVLGRNDEPLFFDPEALASMARIGVEKGPDGKLIAEEVGCLDKVDLRIWSSFVMAENQEPQRDVEESG